MKHAVIIDKSNNGPENYIEIALMKDRVLYLTEAEYSPEELDEFRVEAKGWILRCSGSKSFYADHDSGEDARGYYCEYFDLTEQTAIFDNGKLVGFYVCCNGFRYSGNGRASFSIDRWFFDNPFLHRTAARYTHIVLFAQEETHCWKDWMLLKRDPDTKYESYLSF